MSETAKLRWTGHALIDVGVAGICAFTKKKTPEGVVLADLDRVSEFMAETYYGPKLGTYLSCVFMNASFVQANEGAEKRRKFISQYLHAHRAQPDPRVAGQRCVFSGLPATSPLARTHLPLFSGEDVINFRPAGESWVPVAGAYVVAMMFLPMASRRAEGDLFAVHCEDPRLGILFARRHLESNRRIIELAWPEARVAHDLVPALEDSILKWDAQKSPKRYKYADVKGPRSLLVATLSEIAREAAPSDLRPEQAALTGYLIDNGQEPSCEIFDVPGGVTSFVLKAGEATTAKAWEAVSKRFLPIRTQDTDEHADARAKRKTSAKTPAPAGRPGWSKNEAFEDLCRIYESGFLDRQAAGRWLARYVLGRMKSSEGSRRYQHTNSRMWLLAELFLTEVMGMKTGRIETIKKFADKLADWIAGKNDKRLYRSLMMDRGSDLRRTLRLVQQETAKAGSVIFGLDEYASVWLSDDVKDWLVRDLICIRVVERLAQQKFFDENPDAVVEELNKDDSNGEETEA